MRTWTTIILLAMAVLAVAQGLRNPAFIGNLHYVEAGEAPATPWSPTNVDGLQLWFRSEDLAGLATEGSSVSNWPSAVPGKSERYITNQTASRWPTLTNTFNGRAGTNALVFDGTDDVLWVSNAATLSITRNTNDCTIITVLRMDANAGTKSVLKLSGGSAGPRESIAFDNAEKFVATMRSLDGDTSVERKTAVQPSTVAVCYHTDFVHTNVVEASGSAIVIYTNNFLATNGVGSTPTNTQDTASTYIQMGASSSSFLGEIAELIMYVPAISAADRTNCWLYLSNKYALP